MELQITVHGTPQPKGSRVQVRPGCNIEAGTNKSRKRKKAWSDAIIREATEVILASVRNPSAYYPLTDPCCIEAVFYMPIPKSRLKGKNAIVPGDAHTQKPDADKLLRAIFDPIKKSGIIKDDCFFYKLSARKIWIRPGYEGAQLVITW